jgi:hypothetical protein
MYHPLLPRTVTFRWRFRPYCRNEYHNCSHLDFSKQKAITKEGGSVNLIITLDYWVIVSTLKYLKSPKHINHRLPYPRWLATALRTISSIEITPFSPYGTKASTSWRSLACSWYERQYYIISLFQMIWYPGPLTTTINSDFFIVTFYIVGCVVATYSVRINSTVALLTTTSDSSGKTVSIWIFEIF